MSEDIIMPNIVAISASPRGEKSEGYVYCKELLTKVTELANRRTTFKIYHPQNIDIQTCRGDKNCFNKGYCLLDNTDDMKEIKQDMLNADTIVFVTPIMCQNISTDMKKILERIGYWGHLFSLTGKTGIIVTTSTSNGNKFVGDYLTKMMYSLGVLPIKVIHIANLYNKEETYKQITETAQYITKFTDKKCIPAVSKEQEKFFNDMRGIYLGLENNKDYAYEYNEWVNSRMFNYDDFQDFFTRKFLTN